MSLPDARERARITLPIWGLVALFAASVVVSVAATFTVIALVDLGGKERSHESDLGQCLRVQLERERTNALEAGYWLTLSQASKSSPSVRARVRYGLLADAASYKPPSNCKLAATQPRRYKPPPGILFKTVGRKYAMKLVRFARARRREPPMPKRIKKLVRQP